MGPTHGTTEEPARRQFFARIVKSIQSVIAGVVGAVAGGSILSPGFARREESWLPVGLELVGFWRKLYRFGKQFIGLRAEFGCLRNGGEHVWNQLDRFTNERVGVWHRCDCFRKCLVGVRFEHTGDGHRLVGVRYTGGRDGD